MSKKPLVLGRSAPDVARSEYPPPALRRTRLLNVATPDTALTVSVPPSTAPAGPESSASVMLAEDEVSRLPAESSTRTRMVARFDVAVPLTGAVSNAKPDVPEDATLKVWL